MSTSLSVNYGYLHRYESETFSNLPYALLLPYMTTTRQLPEPISNLWITLEKMTLSQLRLAPLGSFIAEVAEKSQVQAACRSGDGLP